MDIQIIQPGDFVPRILTWAARATSVEQLQRVLDAEYQDAINAQFLVYRLQSRGLVASDRTAVAFYEAVEPICTWTPGQCPPDFGALAWQLEKRWRAVRPRRVTICWATARAAQLFGGLANFATRASQLEHDLGTASVLVRLHETQPDLAADWIGEDVLRRDFAPDCRALKKTPDGAIVRGDRIVQVAEFGGQYKANRLRKFHQHFGKKHRIPYTLW